MKIIDRQNRASAAAERWAEQYKRYPEDRFQDTTKALVALGENPTPEAVNTVIGNKCWTDVPACTECSKVPNVFVVEVGEDNDYDSRTIWLCGGCIRKLMGLSEIGEKSCG